MDTVKIKPPVEIEGKCIIRGQCTEVPVTGAVIKGVDNDGFVSIELHRRNVDSTNSAHRRLGRISAKKLDYEVLQVGNQFRVVITGPNSKRTRSIDSKRLQDIFLNVPKEHTSFSHIRSQCRHVTDALQLKAALCVLQTGGLVECIRSPKQTYYRRVKEWSLDLAC